MSTQTANAIDGPLIPGGWSRWKDIAPFIPFSRETYRLKAKNGDVPRPVVYSGRITVYLNDEINQWLNHPAEHRKKI